MLPDHGRQVVAAVDAAARALGIVPGMAVLRARSLVPELEVVDADPQGDLLALRRFALWAGRCYSPCVAPDPPDGIWIDLTGCAALFGGEEALLADLHRHVAGAGFAARIAVADTAGAAHALARFLPSDRPVTVGPGGQGAAIAPLPVAALRLDSGSVDALRRLGFARIGQLIHAPRGPLARRFGRDLHRRLDQALGHVPEPIEPVIAPRTPRCRRGLVEPIATAPAIVRVIGDLLDELVGRLAGIGKGARRLDLFCHRVDGQVRAVRIGTAAPSRDRDHLARLLGQRIEGIDPGLGIEAMTLAASLVEPLAPEQHETAQSDGARAPDLAALVDRLANRFGQASLYRAAPRASAMPERTVRRIAPLGTSGGAGWDDDLPRPSRMLASPEPVDVTAMLPDHPPAMFVWRGTRRRVVRADGPERLHGEWWRADGHEAETPYAVRDYFQVEVEGGGRYWLFRLGDGERPASGPMRWFIHGAFA